MDTGNPVRIHELEQSTSPVIRIRTIDTGYHDVPNEYKVAARVFSDDNLTLKALKPVTICLERGENLWFAENARLDIYATGDTAAQAIREFKVHLLHFYRHYRDLCREEAVGEALRLKYVFRENFTEASE